MTTALQIEPTIIPVPAGSDLSTKQFYFCDIVSGQLSVAGDGTRVCGVLCNDPNAAGKPGSLQIAGVAIVLAGGSITSGGSVASNAAGKAVAAAASDLVCGVAMNDVSDGEYCQVLLSGATGVALAAAEETISASGALNPAIGISYLEVTGTDALTLAAGSYVGQRKVVECTVAASSPLGTLTLADAYGSESLTHLFTAVGQKLVLEWRTGGWKVIEKIRAGAHTVVLGTDVLTGIDMCARYNLSCTGAALSTGTKGIPNGTLPGEYIDVQVTTAATCPDGEIDITGVTLDNSAATKIDAIDGTTSHHAQFRWDGAAWQTVAITGLALA